MPSQAVLELVMRLQGSAEASAQLAGVGKESAGLGGVFEGLKGKLGDVGGGLSSMISPMGAVTAGVGLLAGGIAAGIAAWSDYDSAVDTIAAKSGLAGDALDAAGESVKNLEISSAGLGVDMAQIGEVMGEVAARTGATGQTLEDFSGQVLKMAKLTGGDATKSVEGLSRTMANWKVPMSESGALLDKIFVASQKSGIGIDQLTNALTKSGGPLRNMGLDLNTSIALMAKWEKGGFNAELMLAGMSKAAATFTKAGVPMAQGLQDVVAKIQGMTDKGKAASAAMEVFGAKAGPALAEAIQAGAFSIEDMTASLEGAEGAIDKTTEAGLDFGDRLEMVWSKVQIALIPLGQALMDLGMFILPIVGVAADMVGPLFQGAFAVAGFAISAVIELLKIVAGALDFVTLGIFNLRGKIEEMANGATPAAEEAGAKIGENVVKGMGTADLSSFNDKVLSEVGSIQPPDIETDFAVQAISKSDVAKKVADATPAGPLPMEVALSSIHPDAIKAVVDDAGKPIITLDTELGDLTAAEYNELIDRVIGLAGTKKVVIPTELLEPTFTWAEFTDPGAFEVEISLKAKATLEFMALSASEVTAAVKKALPFSGDSKASPINMSVPVLPKVDVSEAGKQAFFDDLKRQVGAPGSIPTFNYALPTNPTPQLSDTAKGSFLNSFTDTIKGWVSGMTEIVVPVPLAPEPGGGKAPGLSAPLPPMPKPDFSEYTKALDALVSTSRAKLEVLVSDASIAGKAAMLGLGASAGIGGAQVVATISQFSTTAVATLRTNFTPGIFTTIGTSAFTGLNIGFVASIPTVLNTGTALSEGVKNTLTAGLAASHFIPIGTGVAQGASTGIAAGTPSVIVSAGALSTGVFNVISGSLTIPAYLAQGQHVGQGVQSGIAITAPGAIAAAGALSTGVFNVVSSITTISAYTEQGKHVGIGVQTGIAGTTGGAVGAASGGANGIKNAVAGILTIGTFSAIGQNVPNGLAAGIRAATPNAVAAAASMARQVEQAARTNLGIKSPSTVFMEIGEQMMAGWVIGIEKGAPGLRDAVRRAGEGSIPRMPGAPDFSPGTPDGAGSLRDAIARGGGNWNGISPMPTPYSPGNNGGRPVQINLGGIVVHAGLGADGQSIANAVMDAIGDKLYQDRAIRGNG